MSDVRRRTFGSDVLSDTNNVRCLCVVEGRGGLQTCVLQINLDNIHILPSRPLAPRVCSAKMMRRVARSVRGASFSRLSAESATQRRSLSDSVTYSGGQATTGQGGFYGSGGSRVASASPAHHPEAVARQADVANLATIMVRMSLYRMRIRLVRNYSMLHHYVGGCI